VDQFVNLCLFLLQLSAQLINERRLLSHGLLLGRYAELVLGHQSIAITLRHGLLFCQLLLQLNNSPLAIIGKRCLVCKRPCTFGLSAVLLRKLFHTSLKLEYLCTKVALRIHLALHFRSALSHLLLQNADLVSQDIRL
jgi:hypothetical protein